MLKFHWLTDFSDDTSDPTLAASTPAFGAITPEMVGAVAPLTQVLYLTEPGNTNAIAVSDINQGQIGDCFLLSSIGEIARLKPSFISNMIHQNANGTETVTLYSASLTTIAGSKLTQVSETVTNVFQNTSVNNSTQDVLKGQKEIWVQVLEKADAQLCGGSGANTLAPISNGGYPVVAMAQLTGHTGSITTPAYLTLTGLLQDIAANDLLVFDTKASGVLPNGLFNDHAYMFDHLTGSGANTMVCLDNPWGFANPTPILFSTLAKGIAEIDIGHLS